MRRWRKRGAGGTRDALARAKRAIYRKNSFRGKDLEFRDRYFQHTKEGFVLNPAIRQSVHFYQGNVLRNDFLAGKGTYDFIFCRNLLIYFDRPTQQKVLHAIDRLLAPSGVLFVGPAELPLALDNGFVSAGLPMAFACRKAGHEGTTGGEHRHRPSRFSKPLFGTTALSGNGDSLSFFPTNGDAKKDPSPLPSPLRKGRGGSHSVNVLRFKTEIPSRNSFSEQQPIVRRVEQTAHPTESDLKLARRHADAGRMKEAAAICEAHLRERGACAEAYYLLGLVLDADGHPRSIDYYRKALYLEPNHYDSLLQMALLSQKNGEAGRARAFRIRAQRIKITPPLTEPSKRDQA